MMNGKRRTSLLLALSLLLILIIGLLHSSRAAGEAGAQQEAVGTGFTYQGRLADGGSPADGAYDLRFDLYDAAGTGSLLGTVSKENVGLSDGLFTVFLDFGSNIFTGQARWLEIGVRPGASTGSYTTLTPRQPLTPAPYALALPGLWVQQAITSPNLIGGFGDNSVEPGVVGAVIAGGGQPDWPHRIAASFGSIGGGDHNVVHGRYGTIGGGGNNTASGFATTIGGGALNVAEASLATVGGGRGNRASGEHATIGGGWDNTVTGTQGTIGGGENNRVDGDHAAIGGGQDNVASGQHATVGGGAENTASHYQATVCGGRDNTADGYNAFVGGGIGNTADGHSAYVGGGIGNTASGDVPVIAGGGENKTDGDSVSIGGGFRNVAEGTFATVGGGGNNRARAEAATIPGGNGAAASHYGEMAYASGPFEFSVAGNAQTSVYVLRTTTADADFHELFLDGVSERITIAPTRTVVYDGWLVGRSDGGESAGFHIWGVIENVAGTTSSLGAYGDALGQDDPLWAVLTQASDDDDALLIEVKGNGEVIRWVATVRTVEVAW